MNVLADILVENQFAHALVNSFPCGLMVVDSHGHVQVVNNILECALKINTRKIIGKTAGNVLGCLHVFEQPQGCGHADFCNACEIKKLTFKAFAENQKQNARAYLQFIIEGQVRDSILLLSALPFDFKGQSFCMLMIENLNTLKAFSAIDTQAGFRGIVGGNCDMRELFDTIRQVAQTDASVLIQGESGTGKELAALAVHRESHRAPNHFVPVNCSTLPEGLLETELFGHVKGAFTGAHRDRKGRFELADGGTIFLDEIGELSPATQAKLLRVLEDGSFEPVGSERTVQVNVRVISATNRKLEEDILTGRFRKDLYYRLCVMPIIILPLRDRKDDLPALVDHFLAQLADEIGGRKVTLSSTALSILMSHPWPGNVRELKNVLQFSLVKCQGHRIEPRHLPPTLNFSVSKLSRLQHREPKLHAPDVVKALEKTRGNKYKAAKLLGVSRSTLYRFFSQQQKDASDV